jgi:hypothetical protein
MLAAELREIERVTYLANHLIRKGEEISLCRTDPAQGLHGKRLHDTGRRRQIIVVLT